MVGLCQNECLRSHFSGEIVELSSSREELRDACYDGGGSFRRKCSPLGKRVLFVSGLLNPISLEFYSVFFSSFFFVCFELYL